MKIKIKIIPEVLKKNPLCIKSLLISVILLYSHYFNFRFRVNRIVDISHHINRSRVSVFKKFLIFNNYYFIFATIFI